MGRRTNRRPAVLALGVVSLIAAGALAGPTGASAADPGPAGPAPYYSPWAYRTPLLYRLCQECQLRRAGGSMPDCAPSGPWSYLIIRDPLYIFDPEKVPSGPGPLPPAGSPETGERRQGGAEGNEQDASR